MNIIGKPAVVMLGIEKVVENVVRQYELHLPVGAPFTEAIEVINELLRAVIKMQEDSAAQAAQQQAQQAAPAEEQAPAQKQGE